jgi:putative FmdB family regulatory protein
VPTYAYACTACGHAFDAVQKFSDAALTECPDCGGRLRKVYTSIGVSFKGSGFYRNDSRASSNGSSNGSGASKGTDGATPAEKSASTDSSSTTKDSSSRTSASKGSSGSSSSSTVAAS